MRFGEVSFSAMKHTHVCRVLGETRERPPPLHRMSGLFLPELELYVMLAIARLEPDAYGAAVRKEIDSRTARRVAIGALYATLNRLEDKGLISVREAREEGRRGRPRRYCSLTSSGTAALDHSLAMLGRMAEGLAHGSVSGDGE